MTVLHVCSPSQAWSTQHFTHLPINAWSVHLYLIQCALSSILTTVCTLLYFSPHYRCQKVPNTFFLAWWRVTSSSKGHTAVDYEFLLQNGVRFLSTLYHRVFYPAVHKTFYPRTLYTLDILDQLAIDQRTIFVDCICGTLLLFQPDTVCYIKLYHDGLCVITCFSTLSISTCIISTSLLDKHMIHTLMHSITVSVIYSSFDWLYDCALHQCLNITYLLKSVY